MMKKIKNNELLTRTVTGVVIAAVYIAIAVFSGNEYVMKTTAAIIGTAAAFELCRTSPVPVHKALQLIVIIAAAVSPFIMIPAYPFILTGVHLLSVLLFSLMMLRLDSFKLNAQWKMIALTLMILLLIRSISEITFLENGRLLLGMTVVVCIATDIFAYLIGKKLGRHKLAPKISPGKSIEGSIAGILFGIIFGFIFIAITASDQLYQGNCGILIIYMIIISCVGQFGDLSLSAVKRICGVKDFGKILPGHGGLLDRIDSLLMAVPLSYIICYCGVNIFV